MTQERENLETKLNNLIAQIDLALEEREKQRELALQEKEERIISLKKQLAAYQKPILPSAQEKETPSKPKPAKKEQSLAEVKGILFGNSKVLEYFSLNNKRCYSLTLRKENIKAILAKEEEVYFCESGKIYSLFGELVSERKFPVRALHQHQGSLLDAGGSGLYVTLSNQALISRKELDEKNILEIYSLTTSPEGNLLGLVEYKKYYIGLFSNYYLGLIEINQDSGNYSLGQEILKYRNHLPCQAIAIPFQTLRKRIGPYPFSIISSAGSEYSTNKRTHRRYLDLNGKKIKGTEVEGEKWISNIKLLTHQDNIAELVYSGYGLRKIVKVKLDLKKRRAWGKEDLVENLGEQVYGLELVWNPSLHQKLIDQGNVIYHPRPYQKPLSS